MEKCVELIAFREREKISQFRVFISFEFFRGKYCFLRKKNDRERDTHARFMISPKQNNNNNNKNKNEEEEEVFLPPFFDPILASDRKRFFFPDGDDDDCNDFDDDASISSSLCGKKKKNTTTTSDNKTTLTTPLSCAMNAEINGRFLLLSEDDGDDDMQPDVARVLVLDNLWKEDENFGEEDDDCVKKAFTKALASVRIVGKEEETTKKKKRRRRRRANERRSVLGTGNGGSKR